LTPPRSQAGGKDLPDRVRHRDFPIRFRVSIPSTKPALNRAVKRVLTMARRCGYVSGDLVDIEIAVREALANAMIHGNAEQKTKRVFLRCYAGPRASMLIFVRDEGPGFDPTDVPDPTDDDCVHRSHGRGLFLMRELMDHVEYRRGGTEVLLYCSSRSGSGRA
jgi:serine/threonine-protein kinase RsbW